MLLLTDGTSGRQSWRAADGLGMKHPLPASGVRATVFRSHPTHAPDLHGPPAPAVHSNSSPSAAQGRLEREELGSYHTWVPDQLRLFQGGWDGGSLRVTPGDPGAE